MDDDTKEQVKKAVAKIKEKKGDIKQEKPKKKTIVKKQEKKNQRASTRTNKNANI